MALNIKVDLEGHRFFAIVDGLECLIDFRLPTPDSIDMYHTYVPPLLRNRGIAAELVKFALDYAKQHNLRVIPTCPYVADYISTHRNS